MSISEKIEEVRRKPEHIRVRYFWTMMLVSMFFVLFLWIFSVQENLSSIEITPTSPQGVTDQIREEFSTTQSSVNNSFQKSSELIKEQ